MANAESRPMASLLSPCAMPPCDPVVQSHPVNKSGAPRREEGKKRRSRKVQGRKGPCCHATTLRRNAQPSPKLRQGPAVRGCHPSLSPAFRLSLPFYRVRFSTLSVQSIDFQTQKTTIRTKARAQPTRLQKQLHISTKTYKPSRRSECGDRYSLHHHNSQHVRQWKRHYARPSEPFQVLNGRDRGKKVEA